MENSAIDKMKYLNPLTEKEQELFNKEKGISTEYLSKQQIMEKYGVDLESSKYFTPNIEDIRVGYECEFLRGVGATGKLWIKVVVDQSNLSTAIRDILLIRTPYLTKEQIEAEGWKFEKISKIAYKFTKQTPEVGGNWFGYIINKALLFYDFDRKKLKILFSFDVVEDECVFEGECKDINTFRYICKLLNI